MTARPAILLAALCLSACGPCGSPRVEAPKAPRPVALVNGEPILPEAVARELRDAQAGTESDGPLDPARRRVLDDLIERALLLQDARARTVVVGQDLVEREFLRKRAEYSGTHFDDLLAQERLSEVELKARLREQLIVERLFEQAVFPSLTVSDPEVERYYSDHTAEFDEPEELHVFQIVVASKEEAAQIREKLRKNPQTFTEVARKSSIGPEARNGGDLGFIGKGSGYPEVFDVTFTLPMNTLSQVTPSPYGFHLFKVTERRLAGRRPLEQVRAEILEKLIREKRAKAQEDYLAGLKKRARIVVDEKALAAVNP